MEKRRPRFGAHSIKLMSLRQLAREIAAKEYEADQNIWTDVGTHEEPDGSGIWVEAMVFVSVERLRREDV